MFARLAASAVRMGRLRVAGVAAGVGAAAFGTAMSTAPAQAAPSIPDMLASISAKVEALEAKMEAGDGGGTGFGSFSMAGKSVVVTGGASGIGYGMCELFAKRGATVFLLDLFPDKTEEAAAALGPKVPSHTLPARAAAPPPPEPLVRRSPPDGPPPGLKSLARVCR